MKNKNLFIIMILTISLVLGGCASTEGDLDENVSEQTVLISVKRTGALAQAFVNMSVLIDGEEVFEVDNDETKSVEIIMTEGTHTIQTEGRGRKSDKIKFEVVSGEDNKFYFISEIDWAWGGVDLEERKYVVE